jgi:mersacidin/lichenicidin family type 2 lantibiotic
MSQDQIIEAWKNPKYRASLSEAERAALPAHPAGEVDLSDGELEQIAGGFPPDTVRECSHGGYC